MRRPGPVWSVAPDPGHSRTTTNDPAGGGLRDLLRPACGRGSAAERADPGRVAVRAWQHGAGITVTAAAPGLAEATGSDAGALQLLHDLGVTITAPRWQTLAVADSATLPALLALARAAGSDGNLAAAAAHLAWSAERADFPGTSAVADLPPAAAPGGSPAPPRPPNGTPPGGCPGWASPTRDAPRCWPCPARSSRTAR